MAKNNETISAESLSAQALSQYTPPFSHRGGYIFDADHNMVADQSGDDHLLRIRGWGRLGKLENGGDVQDEIGDLIAKLLTKHWGKDQ